VNRATKRIVIIRRFMSSLSCDWKRGNHLIFPAFFLIFCLRDPREEF
jgi:hypothetical protein